MWQTLLLAYLIIIISLSLIAVVIQSLSHVWFFETPWTAACQASLSFTTSWSLLKFMSIESVMLFNLISTFAVPFSFCLYLSPHQSLSKNSVLTILGLFPIWSKLERWKSGCLMSWPQIFKKCHFEVSSSLILHNNNEPFINWIVMCDEKWILYDNQWWPAQWLDREEAPKHFPKPNLHQERSWSLFGGLLSVWSIIAFWIPAKPLHLRSMLSKPMLLFLLLLFSCSVMSLCDPMACSTPYFLVLQHLLELAQIHVHRVHEAIQSSHTLLSPSPPAFNLSQHQGLFQWVSSWHQVAKVL